jgi:mono/diheme cytochrome c family protein
MAKWAWLVVLAACNGDIVKTESGGTAETGGSVIDTQTPEPTTGQRVKSVLSLTGDVTTGETVYYSYCAFCHGADGTGIASGAADLNVALLKLTDDQIALTILEGKGNMDAYASTLDDQQVADVMAYIKATFAAGTGGTGM